MKVTVNLNYNKQTLATVVGNLNAGIKDGKDCCYFNLLSFTTEFKTSEEDKKNVLDTICKMLTDEGYLYYFTKNKNNIYSKCPFREKVINVGLTPSENNFDLVVNDKIYRFY